MLAKPSFTNPEKLATNQPGNVSILQKTNTNIVRKTQTNHPCCLLHLSNETAIAITLQSMVELVSSPMLVQVPCTPKHCSYLVHWRGKLIPVFDYRPTNLSNKNGTPSNLDSITIFRFKNQNKETLYLGIACMTIEKSAVSDSDFQVPENWNTLYFYQHLKSAYRKDEKTIYILDWASIYFQNNRL